MKAELKKIGDNWFAATAENVEGFGNANGHGSLIPIKDVDAIAFLDENKQHGNSTSGNVVNGEFKIIFGWDH